MSLRSALAIVWVLTAACSANSSSPSPLESVTNSAANLDASTSTDTGTQADCGVECSTKFHCDPNPCLNSGICVDRADGASCTCRYGFSGEHCETLPRTCAAIKTAQFEASDGVYSVAPDSSGALSVYCDMTNDGGGWTKILQMKDAPYIPTPAAVGSITSATISGFAKLADSRIQALASAIGPDVVYAFRGTTSPTGRSLYLWTTAPYADTSVSMGLTAKVPFGVCEGTNVAKCTAKMVSGPAYIDTAPWGLSLDDAERYFTDLIGDGSISCYPSTVGQRCFNAGNTVGYPLIQNLTVWIR